MDTPPVLNSQALETIRVLLIEDNPGDARLIREILARARGAQFELERVERLSTALERLNTGGVDAILLDLTLPDSSGLDTFFKVHTRAPHVPITVLSGFDDEVVAIRAVREGAQDYLVKGQVDRNLLVRALRYAIERKRSEEALQRHDAILRTVSHAAEQFLKTSDLEQHIAVVLRELGLATNVSRVSITENHWAEDGVLSTTRFHQWAAPAFKAETAGQAMPTSMLAAGLGRWELALGRGQLVYGNVADFEPQERNYLAGQGVLSTVVAPVFVGREWWGYVSLEDCATARDWPEVELDGITAAAGILGAAIQKKRGEDAEKRVAQMKDDFIATVSHELRTPLFALQGFLDLLRSGKVQQEATRQEFLATAAQNAQRLMALVNDLLDISRLESGRTKLDMTPVDVGDLINDTLESLRSLAADKQIAVTRDLPASPACLTVVADRAKLRQVLVNLVGNAIKFSEPQQAVVVSAALDGDNVKVSVTDHGPGVAREDLPRLFSKFYQAEKPLTRTTGGVGLGLYISKQIIEAHGGVMGVESILGEGSTFYFVIPTAPSDTDPAATQDAQLYGPRSLDTSKEERWLI
jgi:signal transduction histidine kinase